VGVEATVRAVPHGGVTAAHDHDLGHLVYAGTGCYKVETPGGLWMAPPQQAIWIPPHTSHSARASGTVELYTIYFTAPVAESLPFECSIINVGLLLRALIFEISHWGIAVDLTRKQHVVALLLEELRPASVRAFRLRMPADKRLYAVCQSLIDSPGDNKSLAEWGAVVGASARTLARGFVRETTMTFAQWRQETRLIQAIEWLAQGASIETIARRVGYSSPSAFSEMFKKALGEAPIHYLDHLRAK
jgi:AraC-like DNA-binding protein